MTLRYTLVKRRGYEQHKAFTSILVNTELSEVKMRRVRYIAPKLAVVPEGRFTKVNEQGDVPILGIRYRAIRVFILKWL